MDLSKLNINVNSAADIAPLVKELLPLAATGVKGIVKLVSGLVDLLDKSRGRDLTPEEIAGARAAGQRALARLRAAAARTE